MTVSWIFPVEDDSDPELAYATGYEPPQRPAHIDRLLAPFEPPRQPSRGMRYVVGNGVTFNEQDVPVLRAFLKALEAAPQGTEVISCIGCDCETVWAGAELVGTDNTGVECNEHSCTHGSWHLEPNQTNKGESS